MKAVKSNLLKLARVPLDIGGQFPSWSLIFKRIKKKDRVYSAAIGNPIQVLSVFKYKSLYGILHLYIAL